MGEFWWNFRIRNLKILLGDKVGAGIVPISTDFEWHPFDFWAKDEGDARLRHLAWFEYERIRGREGRGRVELGCNSLDWVAAFLGFSRGRREMQGPGRFLGVCFLCCYWCSIFFEIEYSGLGIWIKNGLLKRGKRPKIWSPNGFKVRSKMG